jgi:hypothetical protein
MLGAAAASLNALTTPMNERFSASRGVKLRDLPWVADAVGMGEPKRGYEIFSLPTEVKMRFTVTPPRACR